MKRLIVNLHTEKTPPPWIKEQSQDKAHCVRVKYGPGYMVNDCSQTTSILEYEEID